MSGPSDSYQRPIDYLRISVTDRCNLRCVYCVPEDGICCLPREKVLSFEEIRTVVQVAAGMGITKVRLSGGEPLVRLGILTLAEMLARVRGIEDLSLSTNGLLLSKYAMGLKEAGVKRVNVSLDTLRPERFKSISRREGLERVLEGLESARQAGLEPVKVNMVVMRGVNEDEIADFAQKSLQGWHVRFIELMPFAAASSDIRFIGVPEIKERLSKLGDLVPASDIKGNGPARYYRLKGARGTIGFISPITEHFCFGCNRLRLTADGKLRPCLLADDEIDVRFAIREGRYGDVERLLQEAVARKPKQHLLCEGKLPEARSMTQIGG
ncbi:MAG: GTP 3',8-cyclase MoaA [Chloroflexi bacterium]|nr:GTP 3',8-cyclase MoaA [Chloroflexota bacterium]